MTADITRQDRLVAGYAALAIAVHVLEAGFPSPIPGIKPGLANVVTLIALQRHGWRTAVAVSALRVIAGSLVIGSLLTPGFWLSAVGAIGALAALGLGHGWNRAAPAAPLSPLGLSLLAAQSHLLAQFALARTVFIPHPGLLRLLPPLLTAAVLFGLASGWAAARILQQLPARNEESRP
jgi:heptaprenyl diphosphate synthase